MKWLTYERAEAVRLAKISSMLLSSASSFLVLQGNTERGNRGRCSTELVLRASVYLFERVSSVY